jgi:hypothetical protein
MFRVSLEFRVVLCPETKPGLIFEGDQMNMELHRGSHIANFKKMDQQKDSLQGYFIKKCSIGDHGPRPPLALSLVIAANECSKERIN